MTATIECDHQKEWVTSVLSADATKGLLDEIINQGQSKAKKKMKKKPQKHVKDPVACVRAWCTMETLKEPIMQ